MSFKAFHLKNFIRGYILYLSIGSMKKKRDEDATEEKSESSRDWLDLRKETLFITLKCKAKGLMQKMQQVIQKI